MPRRLMIVDDDHDVCRILKDRLEALGYEIIVAHNGPTALALMGLEAARDPISGVLLDVMMPIMSGVQVLRELRVQHPAVPVLMMSAGPDRRVLEEAVRAGASGFLMKPFAGAEIDGMCAKIFPLPNED